jgi:hypothetical protein
MYAFSVKGPAPYFDVLDSLHQHLVPRAYVEIGVASGRSLTLALPGTRAVGIDPAPNLQWPVCADLGGLFVMTSDEFFRTNDLAEHLGGRPMDLAFIDGSHEFSGALDDFIHLEAFAHADTTIVLHDCLPLDAPSSEPVRPPGVPIWSGDVWKLIEALRTWRPDLAVHVVDAAPTGLGLVRNLDPGSTVLSDNRDKIVADFGPRTYDDLERRGKREVLGVVPLEWSSIAAQLPSQPFRDDDVAALVRRRDFAGVRAKFPRRLAGATARRLGVRRPSGR